MTDQNISPFVCGAWRPLLVLPESLAETLAPSQLRQILLHELAHVRRNDLIWGWAPTLVRIVFVFHPVVHWVVYRLRLERELACDQLAITYSENNPGDYANTLVHVVDHVAYRESLAPVLRWSGTAQAAD